MFRFALGLVVSAQERVGAILSACTAAEPPIETPVGAPIDVPHAALGLMSEALSAASKAPARARRQWSGVASRARWRVARLDGVARRLGRLPGAPGAIDRARALRAAGRRQLARWTELGRREEAASRALAFDALSVLRENMVAYVSESPDVKRVIREQSEGVAVTAVGGMRDRTARADGVAERAVSRLFGRARARRTP